MGINTKRFRNFQADMEREVRSFPEDVVEPATRKLVLDLATGIILKTPVDTGRARGGWQVELNAPGQGRNAKSKSGRGTIKSAESKAKNIKMGDVAYISNTVKYIIYLEEGSPGPGSDQAPSGMVAITMKEVLREI